MAAVESALRSSPEIWIPQRRARAGLARIAQHHVVAKIVIPRSRQLFVDRDRGCFLASIMNTDEAPAIAVRDRGENRLSLLVRRRCGRSPVNQILRVVH